MDTATELSVVPTKVARALSVIALVLVAAGVAGQIAKYFLGHDELKGFVHLFDLDQEANVPAFFSVLLILICAFLLALTAILEKRQQTPHASKWAVLSVGFLLMGYDEAFSLHERTIVPMRELLGGGDLGPLYLAWVVPGATLVLVLGLYFHRFLLHLPQHARNRFLAAATLYLGGAIGMELLGGWWAEANGMDNWEYSAFATTEESLEIAGLIYLIFALLAYHADGRVEVHVRLDGPVSTGE